MKFLLNNSVRLRCNLRHRLPDDKVHFDLIHHSTCEFYRSRGFDIINRTYARAILTDGEVIAAITKMTAAGMLEVLSDYVQ